MCVNPSNASLKKDKVAPCKAGKPNMLDWKIVDYSGFKYPANEGLTII